MITEFRRLVFSSFDLENAINSFNKEKSRKLPDGDILGMTIVGEPNLCVRVRVGNIPGLTEELEVDLGAGYLAAAMLYHCVRLKIPVPKYAVKMLERAGDGLALSFALNADPQAVEIGDD